MSGDAAVSAPSSASVLGRVSAATRPDSTAADTEASVQVASMRGATTVCKVGLAMPDSTTAPQISDRARTALSWQSWAERAASGLWALAPRVHQVRT